jgi:hypothetical protein
MAESEKASAGALVACSVLSFVTLPAYAFGIALLASLTGSDPAGNAYSQGFAAIAIIFIWLLLALIALIAVVKGSVPVPAIIATAILIPASGLVAMEVLELLTKPSQPPYLWPIVIPAAVPPLVVAFSFWALLPSLRPILRARLAAGALLGAIFLLCAAVAPFEAIRARDDDQIAAAQEKLQADYAHLPADTPLWDLLQFLPKFYGEQEIGLNARIHKRAQRQTEAEQMLDRGDFPLRYLSAIDLDPTPSLCDKVRNELRQQAAMLVLKSGETKPYDVIAQQVADAVVAMNWLVGYGCSCDAESLAWETMSKAYTGSSFDQVELQRMRDPKELGRILRQYPERFSQLTPKAHLKAWLSFADKDEFHDRALAGARQLDHRTADAIEMLNDQTDISAPWKVQKYMPMLDLEVTPALCRAALSVLHTEFEKTARPPADDPRPYSELLARLGAYEPLNALIWVAAHGCDAEPELKLAEDLIGSYQDSFDRQMMLRSLAALHRKP